MMTTQDKRTLERVQEERKRSWRWFSQNRGAFTIGATLPFYQAASMVNPESFQVSGAGTTTGTLTIDEEVIEAKEIEAILDFPGLPANESVYGWTAWYRIPQQALAGLLLTNDAGNDLRANPRYVWDRRPFVAGSTNAGNPKRDVRRRWKRVTVGLGSEFGLLVGYLGTYGTVTGTARQSRLTESYLFTERGMDVSVA